MVDLQAAAGLALVGLGVIAWIDRERSHEERSTYFLYSPRFGPVGRTVVALLVTLMGFALLFTA